MKRDEWKNDWQVVLVILGLSALWLESQGSLRPLKFDALGPTALVDLIFGFLYADFKVWRQEQSMLRDAVGETTRMRSQLERLGTAEAAIARLTSDLSASEAERAQLAQEITQLQDTKRDKIIENSPAFQLEFAMAENLQVIVLRSIGAAIGVDVELLMASRGTTWNLKSRQETVDRPRQYVDFNGSSTSTDWRGQWRAFKTTFDGYEKSPFDATMRYRQQHPPYRFEVKISGVISNIDGVLTFASQDNTIPKLLS